MSKYEIMVIGHQLNNGKVAKAHDIVSEKQLNTNVEKLIEQGFIRLLTEDNGKDSKLSELNKKELIEYALENGYEIDSKTTKEVIVATIEEQKED